MNVTLRPLARARRLRVPRTIEASRAVRDELPFLAGIVFGLAVMLFAGFFEARDRNVQGNDFSYMWAGAHAVLGGHNPYDGVSFPAESKILGTAPPHETVFGYPPWVALALVPLAALPLWVASGLFTYGGMLLAAIGLRALVRARVPDLPLVHTLAAAALLASQPGIAALQAGQWAFLLVAALCWTALGLGSGSLLRSSASVILLAKPQLVLFDVWAVFRSAFAIRGLRYTMLLGSVFAVVVGLPWLVFPGWLEAWRTALIAQRMAFVPPTTPAQALADLIGAPGIWLAVLALFVTVAIGLAFDARGEGWLAIWIAISAAFPVYSWSYDQVVLVVPIVIAAGVIARRSRRVAILVAVFGFTFLLLVPTLLYEIANRRINESYSAFIPLTVLLLLVVSLWPDRRARHLDSGA